jgi:hypothetical protein
MPNKAQRNRVPFRLGPPHCRGMPAHPRHSHLGVPLSVVQALQHLRIAGGPCLLPCPAAFPGMQVLHLQKPALTAAWLARLGSLGQLQELAIEGASASLQGGAQRPVLTLPPLGRLTSLRLHMDAGGWLQPEDRQGATLRLLLPMLGALASWSWWAGQG